MTENKLTKSITNGTVESVVKALTSVMRSVLLPNAEAWDWAEVIVELGEAHKKILLVETPISRGRATINSVEDPEAFKQLIDFRALECGVQIPVLDRDTFKNSGGEANAVDLALLMELGIIMKNGTDDA